MTIGQLQKDPIKQYALKVAQVESGNNPKAKNPYSSAGGIYQFTDSTWEGVSNKYNLGYTIEDKFNPNKAQKAFELFTKDNEKAIQPILGRELNDADRYMTHFLGSGGAGKFFRALQQNPNAPISSAMSPQAIAANKTVALNKDGSQKTLSQVYNWVQNKMNITPTNVTQEFTDYENNTPLPKFATNSPDLVSAPELQQEDDKVKTAQQELEKQTNEQNFIQDFLQKQQQIIQQPQIAEAPIEQLPEVNLVQQYAQVSQFVNNPLMQKGGQIPVSIDGVYKYPNQNVIVPSQNITMLGVNYPIMGTSMETGQQQLMMPNQDYYFPNTKNVLEIPLK